MQITYLSQTCPPEPGATKRPLKQARVLAHRGHDITIVTAFPNYPLGRVHASYRGKLWMREVLDGVSMIRVWNLPAPNRGKVRRFFGFVTFCFSATIAGLLLKRPDCVIASIPKPFTESAAWIIARLRRSYFVIELRDLLPDSLQLIGVKQESTLYRLLSTYYRWIYQRADLFVLAYPCMESQLEAYGVRDTPCIMLSHAFDFDQVQENLRDEIRQRFGFTDSFVAAYAGSFSAYYRVPSIVEAARILQATSPITKLLLIGTGHDFEYVQDSVVSEQLVNVILTGGVPPDDVFGYLQAADVLIHPQNSPELFDGTKIIEYLSAGRPIINICNDPFRGEAEKLGIGISVPWDDAPSLAEAIVRMANDPGLRENCGVAAHRIAVTQFDRIKVVSDFATAFETIFRLKKEPIQ